MASPLSAPPSKAIHHVSARQADMSWIAVLLGMEAEMSDQAKTGRSFGTAWPFMLPAMPEAAGPQTETWFKEQAVWLNEMQKAWAIWLLHRQEAMEATSRTFQTMLGCRDVGSMAAAYGDWVTGSMNRLMAEMNDAREEALRLAECGQRSVAALMQQGTQGTGTVSAAHMETGSRRARGAVRTEGAREASEQNAAE
jgi:hypothetical protein